MSRGGATSRRCSCSRTVSRCSPWTCAVRAAPPGRPGATPSTCSAATWSASSTWSSVARPSCPGCPRAAPSPPGCPPTPSRVRFGPPSTRTRRCSPPSSTRRSATRSGRASVRCSACGTTTSVTSGHSGTGTVRSKPCPASSRWSPSWGSVGCSHPSRERPSPTGYRRTSRSTTRSGARPSPRATPRPPATTRGCSHR